MFRATAARANYLAADRAGIQYVAKDICRDMAKPLRDSVTKLKRLARYLVRYRRGVLHYRADPGETGEYINVYSDSDWAGCQKTRRSTSGGVMLVAGGIVKTWSSTRATVAQSSGEAELHAATKGAAEGLGMVSLMRDLGWTARLRLHVDSSAAKSMASRTGLGKVRHLEVRHLWLHEAVRRKRLTMHKVRGDGNPADWLTKPRSARLTAEPMRSWGLELRGSSAQR